MEEDLEQLRYPIGKFSAPASSMPGIRAANIRTLLQLTRRLRVAIDGLSNDQLNTPYREGGWTVRQVIHHLADSHMNGFIRFKQALVEDWPKITPFNEKAWAELVDSKTLPIETSLVMIEGLHARWVALLEGMSTDDFHRGYEHPENGRIPLAKALALYDWHARHHTAHITQLRGRMGW